MRLVLGTLAALSLTLALQLCPASAADDPLDEAKSLVELGKMLVETGADTGNPKRVKEGVAKLREAKKKFEALLAAPTINPAEANRIKAWIVDVESRIEWYDEEAASQAREARGPRAGRVATGEVRAPDLKEGEAIGAWCRRVLKTYKAAEDPEGRAALARGLASRGGVVALPTLLRLFETEDAARALEGVHEAIAMVGTYRVAQKMGAYARKSQEKHWDAALQVIYLCLEKPEHNEPEKPFLRAIRKFHQLKIRRLSLRILEQLDSMDPEGIAALGEIVYVEDFGYHAHVTKLLAAKRDGRAVGPLVHLMNRFKFDPASQLPAHKALVGMGWYAVPELVKRLDSKSTGIWISFTLRKITGQTMGTDKRKWHDWWKTEKLRHPELFDDPEERPGGSKGPVVTGK
ncbi:MAG: hypothetical protein P1V36_08190 [Planctomycetota bacterium]|nr:hypothetical protein [Planctomycetota bacterium]